MGVVAGPLLCVGEGEVSEVDEGELDVCVSRVLGLGVEDAGSVICAREEEGRIAESKRTAEERWREREHRQLVLLLEAMLSIFFQMNFVKVNEVGKV